tara:strand:+ start:97 stop:516 length:420 start_codon:yes stop_codon:yes gene_type:complete
VHYFENIELVDPNNKEVKTHVRSFAAGLIGRFTNQPGQGGISLTVKEIRVLNDAIDTLEGQAPEDGADERPYVKVEQDNQFDMIKRISSHMILTTNMLRLAPAIEDAFNDALTELPSEEDPEPTGAEIFERAKAKAQGA